MQIFCHSVNLDRWDIFSKEIGHVEDFRATNQMEEGDLMMFHVTQNRKYSAGIYAWGIIVEEPYNAPLNSLYDRAVDVKITHIQKTPYLEFDDYKDIIKNLRTPSRIDKKYHKFFLEKLGFYEE